MTDAAVHLATPPPHAQDPKLSKCIVGWQASEQSAQKKTSMMPKCAEAPNPTLMVMNLSKVPVSSACATLNGASPEEIKAHKGARVTFLVLKVLSPGWTWVGAAGTEKDAGGAAGGGKKAPMMGGRGGNNNNGAGSAPAGAKIPADAKEKLNAMTGEHLFMHSYDLTNVRGNYVKSGRSGECIGISPGMVLSLMVWGKGFLSVFKDQKGEDLQPFDISIVQLGMKSMQSTGIETGNMLEVKSFTKSFSPGLSLSSTRLLGGSLLGSSLQENAVLRSRFVDGSYYLGGDAGPAVAISTGATLNQDMLKGNVSSTVSVTKIVLEKGQGTFAIGPDDVLRFHATQPLSDLPCSSMTIQYDAAAFGADVSKDWVCKLFNVLALAGSVELLVILDSYKTSKLESEGAEMVLEAFARPIVSSLIGNIIRSKPQPAMDIPFVRDAFAATAKYMVAFEMVPDVIAVLDPRLLTKKKQQQQPAVVGTLVHPPAAWERGHAIHFFFDGRLVHWAVVSLASDMCTDGSKHVLSTIAPCKWGDDDNVEVEADADNATTAAAAPAEKKRKRPAAADGVEQP